MAQEIVTNIERMYRAGKQEIPAEEAAVHRVAMSLHDAIDALNVQSARMGDPQIMRDMLTVGGDVYDVLQRAVTTLANCSSAVIKTADHFVQTDDKAAQDYAALDAELKYATPTRYSEPPALPEPEAPGATTTSTTEDKYGRPVETETHVESTPEPGQRPADERTRTDREDREQSELPVETQDW